MAYKNLDFTMALGLMAISGHVIYFPLEEQPMNAYKLHQATSNRTTTVNRQYELEIRLAEKAKGNPNHGIQVLFFIPTAPTPLFINPETINVDNDGYHVFKEGQREPEGLVPQNKRAREILSTVLSRSISLRLMLENGIKVTVMRPFADRPKADTHSGYVEDAELKRTLAKYPSLLNFVDISNNDYKAYEDLPAAVYADGEDFAAVYSTQISSPEQPEKACRIEIDNIDFIDPLKELCEKYNVDFPIASYDPVLDLRRHLSTSNYA